MLFTNRNAENGQQIALWIGQAADPRLIRDLLGVTSFQLVPTDYKVRFQSSSNHSPKKLSRGPCIVYSYLRPDFSSISI